MFELPAYGFPVEIIKSKKRKKTVGIRFVPPGKVELRIPLRFSQSQLQLLLAQHESELQKKLQKLSVRWHTWQQEQLVRQTILYLGEEVPVQFHIDPLIPKPSCQFENDILWVRSPNEVKGTKEVGQLLKGWYKKEAEAMFTTLVMQQSEIMKISINKMKIKDLRTLWGSYSTSGSISLNWKLIMAPLSVIRYVIVHELSHAIHHNHGKNFWKLVSEYDTNYKEHRSWLRRHGWQLTVWE